MNKGLEALKRLFIKIKHYDSLDEKVMLENDYSTIEKELKALEIIITKKVDMHRLLFCDCIGKYNARCKITQPFLTQDEYDLLKKINL